MFFYYFFFRQRNEIMLRKKSKGTAVVCYLTSARQDVLGAGKLNVVTIHVSSRESLSLRINKRKTFRSNSPKKSHRSFCVRQDRVFFPLHFVRVVCVRYIKESAGIISNLTPFRKKKREGRNEKTPAGVVCVCVCENSAHAHSRVRLVITCLVAFFFFSFIPPFLISRRECCRCCFFVFFSSTPTLTYTYMYTRTRTRRGEG